VKRWSRWAHSKNCWRSASPTRRSTIWSAFKRAARRGHHGSSCAGYLRRTGYLRRMIRGDLNRASREMVFDFLPARPPSPTKPG
jgi:hypothetical protein